MQTPPFNIAMCALRIATALLAILLLSRCAQLPGPAPAAPVDQQAHEQRVRAINQWQLQAKAGLRSPAQNGSARLDWQQTPDNFQISLSGPLGQGRVELNGNSEGVTLTQPDSAPLHSASAEALLYEQTGWELPVSLLTDWLLGLPALTLPIDNLTRDDNGLLSTLSQAGWQLSYANYQAVETVFLPSRLIASRKLDNDQELRLVIAVYDWRIENTAP
ncbi:lipoprotein insertase outer membrane protein LolB [Gilvimarinus polysaccharolyticus]|uniref:lipoprotein insertase outer membrane protein LolB n=1 Tax=Gilvimarinus polysaccharolyticus TaxID=863921 RepID=UPI0006736BB2|nr:lipoprotein insertase outer membrane protein LolB [Gilvimarinus polysaccharolyticus]